MTVVLCLMVLCVSCFFFFQAEDGIRDIGVTGVQTCALPICRTRCSRRSCRRRSTSRSPPGCRCRSTRRRRWGSDGPLGSRDPGGGVLMVEPARPGEYEVLGVETVHEGRIITVVRETVAMPGGGDSVREIVRQVGAVCVAAVDAEGRMVMVGQYRHPVRGYLWELPAGLRDADGEAPLDTAKRELAEEAGLAAERWSLLANNYSTPGFCDEQILIYLAEGLSAVDRPEGFVVEHEELDMTVERVPLHEAVQRVFSGGIRNSSAVIGVLAASQARASAPQLPPADRE